MTKEEMEKYISNVPDFPKKGVMFKDFSPLLEEKLKTLSIFLSQKPQGKKPGNPKYIQK